MQIHFNYRYITDETTHETHRYLFTQCIAKKIAYSIEEVGDVVCFAESYQNDGYYVAIYLPYEAATYFNKDMATVPTDEGYVYAAAYVLKIHQKLKMILRISYINNNVIFNFN